MANDVVDLIIADHRRFEALMRDIRNVEADRKSALDELATILVAHAEAEEKEVYPSLRMRADDVTSEEVEHSTEEHDEGHDALLNLLEIGDPEAEGFDDAVEKLTQTVGHHLYEEEQTILNPARVEVSDEVRERLGKAFNEERQRQIDSGCGSIGNVRRLVENSTKADK